jgi:hypothetical protein
MKAVASFAVAVLAVSMSGCATTDNNLAANSASSSKYDQEYMSAVENASRGRGVYVTWVNPPEKKKKSGDKQD